MMYQRYFLAAISAVTIACVYLHPPSSLSDPLHQPQQHLSQVIILRLVCDLCLTLLLLDRILRAEIQTNTVDAMPLIRRRRISLSLEHMSQVTSTVRTNYLNPFHAKSAIRMPRHGTRHSIVKGRPSTSGPKLLTRGIQRSLAAGTSIHALGGLVLVVFTRERRLGALFAQDAELFGRELGLPFGI